MFASPQAKAAFFRALLGGGVAAAFAAIAWAATKPEYAVPAAIAGAFLTRFIAEGGYDAKRADEGDIKKSDVGSAMTPTQRQVALRSQR